MTMVLTSGTAAGLHVPGLLLACRLREAGVDASVEVIERLLAPAARLRVPAPWPATSRNVRPGPAGSSPVGGTGPGPDVDPPPDVDEAELAALFDRWWAGDTRRFVTFSGRWIPVLDSYAERAGVEVDVDLCHLDAVPSLSSELWRPGRAGYRDVWLLDAERGEVARTIVVTRDPAVSWRRRAHRYLAYGGGRSAGTCHERVRSLATWGLEIDVVVDRVADIDSERRPGRFFLHDPRWRPWDDDGFPPFGEVAADRSVLFRRSRTHHGSFDLARRALAIIAPPGGAALLDSLGAATPMVLLESSSDHEARNAELWQRLGFGLTYADWWRDGCSVSALEGLHLNLMAARDRVPSYAEALAEGR